MAYFVLWQVNESLWPGAVKKCRQGFISCIWIFALFFLAIYFYRQAVQLVPDIEFRIKDFTSYNLVSGRFLDTFSIVMHLTEFQIVQFL